MVRGISGAVIGLVVLSIGAGCGSGGSDPITRAEYRKQADAICQHQGEIKNKDVEQGLKERPKGVNGGPKLEEYEEELLFEVVLPPITKMSEELRELEAPEGLENKTEALSNALDDEVKTIEKDPTSAVKAESGFFEKSSLLAKELGLKECSTL